MSVKFILGLLMKRCAIFLSLFLVAISLQTQAVLIDRVAALERAATVSSENHPDADTVLVWDHTHEWYRPDGTGARTNEWYEKILTEKGRRDSRTASFWMNVTYGDVVVEVAECIRPDGTSVLIDVAANSRLMTEPGQMDSNIYDPANKILTLAFPGLEVGDVLRLVVVRKTTKARVPDAFSDYSVFEHTAPILEMVHELDAPAELPLATIRVRDEIGGGVAYSSEALPDGGIRHRWRVADVPRAFPEPDMPALHTCGQRLLVSTLSDWETLSKWYWNLSAPRLAATVPAMQEKVDALIDGALSRDERIWRIFTYVSQKIRYMGVTPEDEAPGYEPHDVCLTFENQYGVCRDKAALLVVMLRMAGVEAYPVLIHVGERRDPDVPQIYFNHAIVAAVSEDVAASGADRYILMDPTNENIARLLPEYLCEKSFLVARPDGDTLLESPALPATENMLKIETTGMLADRWLRARTRITPQGVNDTMYRSGFSRMRRDDRRRFVERMLQRAVPGAVLTDLLIEPTDLQDTSVPLFFTCDYAVPGGVVRDQVDVAMLPRLASVFGMVNFIVGNTGLETRRFPLQTEIPCGVEERISLQTDFAERAFSDAGPVIVDVDGVGYVQNTTFTGGVLVAESRFTLEKSLYSPEEYQVLRAAFEQIETAQRAVPIWDGSVAEMALVAEDPVAQGSENPDDVLVLFEETVLEPENATNAWIETVHVRKKILSYAGKIREGDIKIPFNPAMNAVELLSATVTQPDGTVHEVTDLEKNIMDQPWVASAPRYPAGKMLVVNFPGLEVGSIIDYTIQHRCYGSPFHAYTKRFGGFDDIEKQTLTIKGKDGVKFAKTCKTRAFQMKGPVGKRYRKEAEKAAKPVSPEPVALDYVLQSLEGADGGTMAVCTNIPGVIREDNMPPTRTVFRLTYGVLPEVDAFGYATMIQDHMNEKAEGQPLTTKKAGELVVGMTTVAEKVQAIRDFVVKNIRENGPGYHTLPLSMLSAADETLRSGYGHAVDVAILLQAMLRAVGIESRGVFIDGSRVEQDARCVDVHSYGMFDTVLVAVDDGDVTYYVNDGSQYSELRATHADGMIVADVTSKQWIELKPDADYSRRVSTQYNMDVQENGTVIMNVETEYFGTAVEGFRKQYLEMTPEKRRRHVLEVVSGISRNAVLEGEYEVDTQRYPGRRRFSVRIPGWAVVAGEFLNIRLPGAAATAVSPRYGERRLPFYRESSLVLDDQWNLSLPEGSAEIVLQPQELDFQVVGGATELETVCSTASEDGRLRLDVKRRAVLGREMFGPEAYAEYMKAALKAQGRAGDTVIVRMGPHVSGQGLGVRD